MCAHPVPAAQAGFHATAVRSDSSDPKIENGTTKLPTGVECDLEHVVLVWCRQPLHCQQCWPLRAKVL
jgi:hypothetical protein